MNVQSNAYTFIYAAILVIVVAAVLSFTAISLQDKQENNIRIEKFQNILSSVAIESTVENAEQLFEKYITESFAINTSGEKIEGIKAFDIDLKKQLKSDSLKRTLPIFVCIKENKKYIILPVRGKGLWGPIWGYIALEDDYNTIYGTVFDHKGETPGLGADINQKWFQTPFTGKKLFDDNGKFVSITVYKGGAGSAEAAKDFDHGVDAISGGTITSKGLEAMMREECLINYRIFLENNKTH